MIISTKQYTQSLYEALKNKKPAEIKDFIHNFGLILARQNDLDRSEEIILSFKKLWDYEHGELSAELVSARLLEPIAKKVVLDYLQVKSGKSKVNLQEKINSDLIGGFILHYNSRVLDGSLRSSLVNLKNKISN